MMIKTAVSQVVRVNHIGILSCCYSRHLTTVNISGRPHSLPVKPTRTADDSSNIQHEDLGKVNIRKATLTDYDSVLAIPPHGGQFDSIPDRYCAFISCNSNTGYLANKDGIDVGFVLTHYVDGGSTLVLDNCRASKNTGVRNIRESVLKHIKENPSQIATTASVRLENGAEEREELGNDVDEWNITTKRLKQHYSTPNLLESVRSSGSKLKTAKRLHSHDVIKVMNCPDSDLYQNLFKDERIMKSGIPYRPMTSNVSLLMDKRTLVIGSNMKENKQALFSIGTYSFTNHGLNYNLSFYGNTNEDLEEHLYVHMMSLLNRRNTKVTFEIHVEQQKDLSLIRDVMKRYNMEACGDNNENKEVIWYETTLC